MTENKEPKQKKGKKETLQPPTQVALQIKEIHEEPEIPFLSISKSMTIKNHSLNIEQWFWDHIKKLTLNAMKTPAQPALTAKWQRCFG